MSGNLNQGIRGLAREKSTQKSSAVAKHAIRNKQSHAQSYQLPLVPPHLALASMETGATGRGAQFASIQREKKLTKRGHETRRRIAVNLKNATTHLRNDLAVLFHVAQ